MEPTKQSALSHRGKPGHHRNAQLFGVMCVDPVLKLQNFRVTVKQVRRENGIHAGKDGRFQSPPLSDGSYVLRFAGILQKPANAGIPSHERGLSPDRIFDFLYPNAHDVTYASAVVVERAQTVDLQVRIPRPMRYRVRGRVQGELPEDRQYISLQFTRELGTLDPVGWAGGAAIQSDGSFEGLEQPGNYRAEICQFAPPEPSGRTHLVRSFGSANFRLDSEDISDVKIQVGSDL
jgi:hypothetical protein